MAFLLIIVLLSTTGTLIESASNKTDCDINPSNSSCTQASPCAQSPCQMLCGLTTPYDTCQQSCGSDECNVLQCRASNACTQICILSTCGSLTCDANQCIQSCASGNCSSQTCPSTVNSCTQISAGEMTCEANACFQSCSRGECRMICTTGGNNCTQVSEIHSTPMNCDRGFCQQMCSSGGCDMSCSSSATTGSCLQSCGGHSRACGTMSCDATNCTQVAQGRNANLRCEGDVCEQSSFNGDSTLTCPAGVKKCKQIANDKNTTLQCDGEMCEQNCFTGECNMVCSASAKECHQICLSGECLYKCDAKICKLTCLGSCSSIIATTKPSEAPIQIGSLVLQALMLAFPIFM